ncbi:ACD11-like protein [Dichanthelium oligosanthes]|uniref:ACD11-like protein n=1 Tax=Dichanthelium oligosanthes TaxID=888268 RepID=A0A1E5VQH1_9POAL|nr:ACD11-like protein [Dichanthelium oligosanthes]
MLGFRTQMPWSSAQAAPQEQLCEGAAAVVAARQGMETPLTAVAEAFEELARGMDADGGELRLAPFGDTCALVSVLFSSLGMAFRFAEIEYVTKVNDLIGAGKSYGTLSNILDKDIENDCVKKQGSHSRNLRRVRLGLGLIKALFENFLTTEGSLYDAATAAYGQVCAPFHSWAIRKAVGAGMYTLPSREQLIVRLNETDFSVQKEMRRYIDASSPIIEYIDNLFLSRNISLDW